MSKTELTQPFYAFRKVAESMYAGPLYPEWLHEINKKNSKVQ